jgi:hypothetical protein
MTLLQADPTPISTTAIVLIVLGFPVVFGLMWFGVVGLLSAIGGWHRIASRFPGTGSEVVAESFSGASGALGARVFPVNYKHCLHVGVADWGIGLSVALPFRFRHPPISVPWEAVESCAQGWFGFWPGREIRLRSGERIILRGQCGAAVEQAWNARQPLPAAQPVS